MRFAARPVGAASNTLAFFRSKSLMMALITVVLPVPGPPVITSTLPVRLAPAASTCSLASSTGSVRSTPCSSFSASGKLTDLG